MRERSNRAVSKTVELKSSGGSNPPLSARKGESVSGERTMSFILIWKDVRVVDGAVLERLCTERYRGFESPSFRILPQKGDLSRKAR